MWRIPKLNNEFKERMENLIDLYMRPLKAKEPVICLDEKRKQLLAESRTNLPVAPGKIAIRDYEYIWKAASNIFVAVEPMGGKH